MMISIITSTYNKVDYLDLTLAGYQNQSYSDFEIVIVDDGSNDHTDEVVRKYCGKLNIKYYKQENMGIAAARNVALQLALGNYIIIVDDDRIPGTDFVYEHNCALDKNAKTVSIGCQGLIVSKYTPELKFKFKDGINLYNKYPELLLANEVQLFNSDDVIYNFTEVINKYFLSLNEDGLLLQMAEKYGDDLTNFQMAWSKAYGGNIAFDRQYLTADLKYDCNYKKYGCEDIDFSYQLYLQGYKFRFTRNAINYHQEHRRNITEYRELYNNFQYFCNKYPHLEVLLMKMDWDGMLSLEEANNFNNVLKKYHNILLPKINEYISRMG